jgi:hypothetical protein
MVDGDLRTITQGRMGAIILKEFDSGPSAGSPTLLLQVNRFLATGAHARGAKTPRIVCRLE